MEIQAVRTIDNNRSEIVCKNKINKNKEMVRYFSVPTEKQDEFIKDFKKQYKNLQIWGTVGMLIAGAIGGGLAGKLAKRTIPSLLLAFVGGFVTGTAALWAEGTMFSKAQKKLFEKYNAKEHTYLGQDGKPEVLDPKSKLNPQIEETENTKA